MVLALRRFSWEYFCGALASSVYYLTIAKYSWENFRGALKNCKKLAQSLPVYGKRFVIQRTHFLQNDEPHVV